jgi:hypothetical protein
MKHRKYKDVLVSYIKIKTQKAEIRVLMYEIILYKQTKLQKVNPMGTNNESASQKQ